MKNPSTEKIQNCIVTVVQFYDSQFKEIDSRHLTTHVARQKYCPIYVSRSTENKVITMSAVFPSNLNSLEAQSFQ